MGTALAWDISNLSQDEDDAMAEWFSTVHAEGNLDLEKFLPYMTILRPDALKKYRRWVEAASARRDLPDGLL